MISGKAKLAGVMGWPVAHSLSPKLHNEWLRRLRLDGAYLPLAVAPEHLADALRLLPHMGFAGCNLTIPHKEQALPLMDEVSQTARRIGAVNTVWFSDGLAMGDNSDAYGFARNLKDKAPLNPKQGAVLVGAGGAARAIGVALQDEGFADIVIINRTEQKAQALARALGAPCRALSWEKAPSALGEAGLLVNATALGMDGQPPLNLSIDRLREGAVVADIVYRPLMTPLLREAQRRGHPIVTGLGMLIHQAVPGFTQWFGQTPPVDAALEPWLLGENA